MQFRMRHRSLRQIFAVTPLRSALAKPRRQRKLNLKIEMSLVASRVYAISEHRGKSVRAPALNTIFFVRNKVLFGVWSLFVLDRQSNYTGTKHSEVMLVYKSMQRYVEKPKTCLRLQTTFYGRFSSLLKLPLFSLFPPFRLLFV